MACYHPLRGYRSPVPNRNGKFGFVFDKSGAAVIPCGRCIGCRIDRSRMWAIRCVHEASLYENNCFVTLTYNEEHLPPFGSLVPSDLQKFVKRLRKRFGSGIRFYACGEYGEAGSRPHYHLCIFNFSFTDQELWSIRGDVRLFVSPSLDKLWLDGDGKPIGFATVGEVTFESAAYVARYCMKKVVGSRAEAHYTRLVEQTGELVPIEPEFTRMSLKPGIGARWLEKFGSDVYPGDFVVFRGKKYKVPRYYDVQLEKFNSDLHASLKEKRYFRAVAQRPDCTPERLAVREQVVQSQLSMLKRSL